MVSILKGFLPWILYSILYGPSPFQFKIALTASILSSLFLDRKELKAGFILTWCTLLYFIGLFVYTSFHEAIWLKQNMWLVSNLALATIVLGSIVIKNPFTLQYAKQTTPESFWKSALFIEINYILTVIWGVIFLFSAFTNYLHTSHWHLDGVTYFIVNNIGWVIGAYLSQKFPDYWKKRKLTQQKIASGKIDVKAESEFLEGNYAPWRSEDHFSNLDIIGKIPDDLNGVLLRNGPNPQFDPINEYHWFEGDGMVHAIQIQNGKASYDNKWVRTNKFKAENKAKRALFSSGIGDPSVDDDMRNTANTNIITYQKKILALNEGATPVEMLLPNLETVGDYTFEKQMQRSHTAHPRFDHRKKEYLTYSYANDDGKLIYYCFDNNNKLIAEKEIAWPYVSMMHDFVITENYVIFPVFPCTISIERMLKGEPMFMWEGDQLKTHFIITDRMGNEIVRVETDPCFVFHFANAYEQDDYIIVDALINETVPLFPDRHGKIHNGNAKLGRWAINLKTKMVVLTYLDKTDGEFPRFDERLNGYPYHHIYYAGNQTNKGQDHLFDCIVHYDLKNSVKHIHDFQNDVPWEPVFVPRSDQEGDGYLLTPVYRTAEDRSDIVILDANNIEADPIAVIKIPHRVPYGFHGNFICV